MDLIRKGLQKYDYQNNRDTLLFRDPLSGGMMNINDGGGISFLITQMRTEMAVIFLTMNVV